MKIETFTSPCLYANSYLCTFDDFALVVDPSIPYETIKEKTSKEIRYVLITHTHYDHICEIKSYMNKGIIFFVGKEDYDKLFDAHLNLSLYIIGKMWEVDLNNEKVVFVSTNTYNLDNEKVTCFETKGHTNGSITYYIEKSLFTGDFIFKDGYGRTDFPTGSYKEMQESIQSIKKTFENKSIDVFPGHGGKTNMQCI